MTDQVSRNSDVRMCGSDYVRRLFHVHAPGGENPPNFAISAIEGVMGLFDGGQGSAATLARSLDFSCPPGGGCALRSRKCGCCSQRL